MQDVVFLTITPRFRLRIATTIERLIELLDRIDRDPDMEPYLAGFDSERTNDREDEGEDGFDLAGASSDNEADPAEDGIADLDALLSEDFMIGWTGDRSGFRLAGGMLRGLQRAGR